MIYEVGVCDTWGKTVFLIVDHKTVKELEDHLIYLGHRRVITYDNSGVGLSHMEIALSNAIRENRSLTGLGSADM